MKRLMAKMLRAAGETLVETLAAILVCTLAVTMLATSVATAGNLNQRASVATVQVNYQQKYAANGEGYGDTDDDLRGSSTGVVSVSDPLNASYRQNDLPVVVHGGDDLVSYQLEVTG